MAIGRIKLINMEIFSIAISKPSSYEIEGKRRKRGRKLALIVHLHKTQSIIHSCIMMNITLNLFRFYFLLRLSNEKRTIIYFRSIFEWNSMVNEQISALGDKTDGILGRQKKTYENITTAVTFLYKKKRFINFINICVYHWKPHISYVRLIIFIMYNCVWKDSISV